MRFRAFTVRDEEIVREYYSVGGGTVRTGGDEIPSMAGPVQPFAFATAAQLLSLARSNRMSIADIVLANEVVWRPEAETLRYLDRVHEAMMDSVARGCATGGILPGGLKVQRRAKAIFDRLTRERGNDPLEVLDWVSVYALAVNEENAAGGRVVTAPTNGAAGVIPAVLKYHEEFCSGEGPAGRRKFLLTAAGVGLLFRRNASISAAEMGCQGEIGVACSMAAAGLAAAFGGTLEQVENAAEIGMEHNLGLTCDPVGGLVQIPCIERNTMGAVKAINAARLALAGDGRHIVSLDAVIEAMRQTGTDMQTKYKETSLGGLAVNVIEC
jgi:L-serine dehydratase